MRSQLDAEQIESYRSNGFVVIDDYNDWEGAKAATDEYRAAHGIDAPLVEIDISAAYWQKPR